MVFLLLFVSVIPYDLWHLCLLGQNDTDSLHRKDSVALVWTNCGMVCCSHFHCHVLFPLLLIRISLFPLSRWKHPLKHLQRWQCDMTSTNCNKTIFFGFLFPLKSLAHRMYKSLRCTYTLLAHIVSSTSERQTTLVTDTRSNVNPIKQHIWLQNTQFPFSACLPLLSSIFSCSHQKQPQQIKVLRLTLSSALVAPASFIFSLTTFIYRIFSILLYFL